MNQLINSNVKTMSSLEIAGLTMKQHQHVKRDIEKMCEQLQIDASNFGHTYLDSMNRKQTAYLLDQDTTMCLVSGYSAPLRMAIIKRWQELEAQSLKPTLPDFTNPVEAARAWANEVEAKQIAQKQLELAAPKVEFVEKYVESVGNKGFREVAKLLKIKEPKFRDFLTNNKIMYRLNGALMGYANHIDAGRFHVSTGLSQSGHAFNQCLFTPKGVEWIAAELAKESVRGK